MVKINLFKHKNNRAASLKEASACVIAIDEHGSLCDQSESAFTLAGFWLQGNKELITLVDGVRATGLPAENRITEASGSNYWVVASPQGEKILVLAHDTTMPDQMLGALLESRTLLKSLLDAAVDFSFEVDELQVFRFVSPKDAFGYNAEGWIGQSASDLFWPRGNQPARNPFTCYQAQTFDSVAVEIGGALRSVTFSVSPSLDEDGKFKGVRGTCRDVTTRVEKQKQTQQDNLRLSLQQKITEILNATENAQDLLTSASKELIDFLRADLAWSIMKYNDRLVPAALCGESVESLDFESIWEQLEETGQGVHQIEDQDRVHLAIQLKQGDNSIGMIVISRDTDVSPWAKQEVKLLEDVVDILTVAFSKAQLVDRLYRLSGKDDLTGILNRRAITEVVEQRLQHQCRTGQSGSLMFIDLDNFKEVNDTLGHAAGDDAIKMVAKALEVIIRSSDVAGRFGGDEFVVWLEDAGPEIAERKARMLLDEMPGIRKKLGNSNLKLGASVGICQSVPSVDLTFVELTERADAALYNVKKTGKNNIAFADDSATRVQD